MSNAWYNKQFGEREHFAIHLSFNRDSRPTGDPEFDAAWGGLSIWVRGRCLTRSVSAETGVMEDVRWSLLGIFDWLTQVGVRLINEEPFPVIARGRVLDACDWYNETETVHAIWDPAEEAAFFHQRSDWRDHHALRRAAVDAALPNITFRRLGDFLEVSWDNQTWSSTQPGLAFVEPRGTELVSAAYGARVLAEACCDATAELARRNPLPALAGKAASAAHLEAKDRDWCWLVPSPTARTIVEELPELATDLDRQTRDSKRGLYIPHGRESLVLRQTRLTSKDEIESLLLAMTELTTRPMSEKVRDLVCPGPLLASKPWEFGYDQALRVRDLLGWGTEPAPPLRQWLQSAGIQVLNHSLPDSVDLIAARTETMEGGVILNPQQQRLGLESAPATALGHMVCDEPGIFVEGSYSQSVSSARAKAFGAMLLLPVDGIRAELEGLRRVNKRDVQRVMQRYGTTPYLTTFHLMNLGFIANDEERIQLVQDLAA